MTEKGKAIVIILCLLAVFIFIGLIWPKARTFIPVETSSEARNFTLTSSTGDRVNLASFKGKSIVVMAIINPYT
jgi:cytochrome oxidase Cu insertion factor (SCO1/SenC/PrrC family)